MMGMLKRLLKATMAEFSYLLEKYLSITNILPTVVAIAACCSMFIFAAVCIAWLAIQRKQKKDAGCAGTAKPEGTGGAAEAQGSIAFIACVASMWLVSVAADSVISSPQEWDSKMHRVMENFEYVMSFDSYREVFFGALGIQDSEESTEAVFQTACSLSAGQWDDVAEAAGNSSWYFTKVQDALDGILIIGGCRLQEDAIGQCTFAYLPAALSLSLAIAVSVRRHGRDMAVPLFTAGSSLFFCTGGAVFLCVMAYVGAASYVYLLWLKKQDAWAWARKK